MPDTYVKVSGSWRKCNNLSTKVSGSWRRCKTAYAKVSGVWKQVYVSSEYRRDIFGDGSCLGLWRFDGNLNGEDGTPNASMYHNNEAYIAGKSGQAFDLHNERVIRLGGIDYRDVKAWSFWVFTSTDLFINIIPDNENAFTFIRCSYPSNILFVDFRAKHDYYDQYYLIVEGRVDNAISNHWYHIVVQWHYNDKRMYGSVYVNGNLNASSSYYPIQYPYYGDALIGLTDYDPYSTPGYCSGYIDHLRVFNRELSAAEVQTLYHELG